MADVKALYVRTVRAARRGAAASGLLAALERRRDSGTARWLRSLFAIYDLDDMVHLDLPWWTFEAITCVEHFLRLTPQAGVFEYGSGASTLWLAKRARAVTSVEHDPQWTAQMDRYISQYANIDLITIVPAPSSMPDHGSEKPGWQEREFGPYVAAIEGDAMYDLIVIDGRARSACLTAALSHLNPGGLIVFDDSSRARYQTVLRQCQLPRINSHGLRPGLPYPSATTLLARDPEVLKRIGAE